MTITERIELFDRLGRYLELYDERLQAHVLRTAHNNLWFTEDNQKAMLKGIAQNYLVKEELENWVNPYGFAQEQEHFKTVGLVLAGNIPLVGFHDVLSVMVSGHKAQVKLSDKDPYLLPFLIKVMTEWDNRIEQYIEFVPKLAGFDAVIATGSNNTARYFEAYFEKYPNIIRRNRNAVGVLTGDESSAELNALGHDVFRYFGLGCRNVAKLYVPEGYDFKPLLEALHEFRNIIQHGKYKNNFDYNYAIYELNSEPYLNNGCIIMTENEKIQSHIAGLYFEYYVSPDALEKDLTNKLDQIQLIVGKDGVLKTLAVKPFGKAQEPGLADYADGVDTLKFLSEI